MIINLEGVNVACLYVQSDSQWIKKGIGIVYFNIEKVV